MKRTAADELKRRLRDEVGFDVEVEDDGGTFCLVGNVDSVDSWQLAADIATQMAPNHPIDNRLVIEYPVAAIPEALEEDEADSCLRANRAL